MNNIKNQLRNWNKKMEEKNYCCSKCGYLFHNYDELRDFSNNNDYFSLGDEILN